MASDDYKRCVGMSIFDKDDSGVQFYIHLLRRLSVSQMSQLLHNMKTLAQNNTHNTIVGRREQNYASGKTLERDVSISRTLHLAS